jgi:putative membrane protein
MTTAELFASTWSLRPVVLVGCGAALAVHGAWRGFRSTPRTAALLAAIAAAVVALASPVDALAAGYLFSAHMLQHLLLVLVVPPLLLMALPPSPKPLGGPLAAVLRRPFVTWGAGLGAMWLWHEQTLCNAASQSGLVRGLQSLSLLVMGAMFYWPLLAPHEGDRRSPLAGVAYLFSACVGCTVLGILITFSPVEVCPAFLHPTDPLGMLPLIREGWGLSPSQDQQIGGLMMWVPACLVYSGGILGLLSRWYRGEEAR